MATVKSKNTKPEILVRKRLFKEGFRYRTNNKTLSGSPDIVLPKYDSVIFVHGCFWHGHHCKRATKPTSNTKFWEAKIQSNIDRDKRVRKELTKAGWIVLTVWDCELKNKKRLEHSMSKLIKKLNTPTRR